MYPAEVDTFDGFAGHINHASNTQSSHNYAMMGHVKEWFTKYLAGISAVEVGYDVIDIKPSVIGELTRVSGTIDSVHGTITSAWEHDPATGTFTLKQ